MSVVRAFTNRRVKQSLQTSELNSLPQRGSTKNASAGVSIRNKISSPVELLHTTNVLAYNAPDLYPNPKTASSTNSHRSDDDMSDSAFTAGTTPPTSPDIETSPKRVTNPKRTVSPEPNHLSAYFAAPGQTVQPQARNQAPIIPQRAPSHSKKTYTNLARQRSVSNVSANSQQSASTNASYTFSRSPSNSTATSAASQASSSPVQHRMKHSGAAAAAAAAFVAATPPPKVQRYQHRKEYSESHPFGPELQQVSEIAEEYGVKEQVNVVDAEEKEMIAKGLLKFTAGDYLGEIRGLISSFFVEEQSSPAPVATAAWI
ncbi:hypothetical protein QBC38DRAFT_510036 [Podospora fimiseda]|uniref:Uncharacterized protein n=1 Tax=Podospora fimiseda TaxID=252190 RepID=A0AAN7BNP9_9PEZI|nr:hypothetical protein QBC38DRAFT_510036 [Podospora fimiseda]